MSILVNNAGITRDNLAMRMKDEEWSDVISTNLSAVFRMTKLVMRGMMKARFGRVINITSVVGSMGNPGQANYAAAKAGVAGMTRALARELGSRNITVNCIAPRLHRYGHDASALNAGADFAGLTTTDTARPFGSAGRHRRNGQLPRFPVRPAILPV